MHMYAKIFLKALSLHKNIKNELITTYPPFVNLQYQKIFVQNIFTNANFKMQIRISLWPQIETILLQLWGEPLALIISSHLHYCQELFGAGTHIKLLGRDELLNTGTKQ